MNRIRFIAGAMRDLMLLVGAVFTAAGLGLALAAASAALEYREAIELHAVVTAKERVRADRKTNPATRFVARYRVKLPGAPANETEEDLPRETWEKLDVGDTRPVLYLASKGRTLPPAWSGQYISHVIMGAFGALFSLVGGLLLIEPVGRLRARISLLGRGVQGSAAVCEVFQTSTSVNHTIMWQLRYRYRDPGGREHEGVSELLTPGEAAGWQAGASGPILYDPTRPANSAWLDRHATPPDPAAPGLGVQAWSKAKTLLRWILNLVLFFAALLVAAVIAELVPELKELATWMEDRRQPLVMATGAAAALGVFLLVGAVIAMLMQGGEPMGHGDVENHQRSMRDAQTPQRVWRASTYRLWGKGAGAEAHDAFSLAQFKRALASGVLLRDPVWRRRSCAAGGAVLIFIGLFGVLIVVMPLALKLVLAAIVLYAVARTGWALLRA